MRWGVAIVGILAWPVQAFADAPLEPPSQITRWSSNRRYCAVADPKRDAVAVYRIEGSRRTELWAVTPWQRVFDVADDGDHLVTCYGGQNLLPRDYKPAWTMLQFFERGTLVRKWSLGELISDLSRLKRTVSHYEWGSCVGFDDTGMYNVRTADRGIIRFDPRTGSLIK